MNMFMNRPLARRGSAVVAALHGMAWGAAAGAAASFLGVARENWLLGIGHLFFFVLLLPYTGTAAFLLGLPLSRLQAAFCGPRPSFWGILITTTLAGPLLGALAWLAVAWAASPLTGDPEPGAATLGPAVAGGLGTAFGSARCLLEERRNPWAS